MGNSKNLLAGLSNIPVLLSKAKQGETSAAKELLDEASKLIKAGKVLPQELADWVSNGLAQLSISPNPAETVKDAFDLRKPRGAPQKHSEEFEMLVADAIHYSGQGLHKGVNSSGAAGAYDEAAIFFDISPNTAEKYYKKHVDSIHHEEQIRREIEQGEF